MSNEIVKFSNQFNNVALRKFDATHLDVLMAIASRVRDKGTDTVTFTFAELRDLMRLGWKMSNRELARKIVETNRRLLALNYEFTDDEGGIVQFALFNVFRTMPASETLEVSVNALFSFLLNDLTSQFTRFELAEFTGLSSRYAKEFYRRVKQFRATGSWTVTKDEFCRLLDVPPSIASSGGNLNKRVIKPILDEVGPLIDLQIKRTYRHEAGTRGRGKLYAFTFTFRKEEPPRPRKKKGKGTPVPDSRMRYQGWDIWYPGDEGPRKIAPSQIEAHLGNTVERSKCPICRLSPRNIATHGQTQGTLGI